MLKYGSSPLKSNLSFLKEINEARIFNLIREEKQISRIELSKKASMSKTTVSEIINRLLDNAMIYEEGKGESTTKGGKRPVMLQINPAGGFVFGIQIKRTKTCIVISDLSGSIIAKGTLQYKPGEEMDPLLKRIFSKMDQMIRRMDLDRNKLLSVGIAIPGFVDDEDGELIYAATMEGWAKRPLVSRFIEHFDVPTYLENDVNVLAWAEFVKGAGSKCNDMLCINIGDGLGAGIIENNSLVRGLNGGAGEVGFISLEPYKIWLKDSWFFNGQNMLGDLFSKNNLMTALQRAYSSADREFPFGEINEVTLYKAVALADTGDAIMIEYAIQFARIFALIVASTTIILGSSMVVLSGRIFRSSATLNSLIVDHIKENLKGTPFYDDTVVQLGVLEDEETLRGTIEMAMDVFKRPYGNGVF